MPRRRGPGADLVLSVGILAAAAGALILSGCTTAGPSAANTANNQNAADAVAQPAAIYRGGGGGVHLVDYSDNDGPSSSVILTGAIGDYGKAVSVNPDGSVNPEHDSQLRLDLSHGSFRLDIAALDRTFVEVMRTQFPTNASTCSGSVSASHAVPIVAGSGTGAYQGVSGQFDLTIKLDEVDSTSSHCDGTAALLSQMLITSGTGHVRVH
jgi:hypothetical protein